MKPLPIASPEAALTRAAGVLWSRMTAPQRFAFEFPGTDVRACQDSRFNRLVDEHHGDTAWRVLLFIDATPDSPERWPCWHCTVVWGEMRRGIARPAVPLFEWKDAHDWTQGWVAHKAWHAGRVLRAFALVGKELAGVGLAGTLAITDPATLMVEGLRRNVPPSEVVGISGRVKLTVAEAQACLPAAYLQQFTSVRAG